MKKLTQNLLLILVTFVFMVLLSYCTKEETNKCSTCPSGMYLAINDPDGIGCICCDNGKTPNPNNGYLCE